MKYIDKVILSNNSKPYIRKRMLEVLIMPVFLIIGGTLLGSLQSGLIGGGAVFLLFFLSSLLNPEYDGWEITDGEITITKYDFPNRFRSKKIHFNSIKNITYGKASFWRSERNVPSIGIYTNEGLYLLTVGVGHFEFAHNLMYFKERGIKVNLLLRDYELEQYLEGNTETFPIQNRY